MEKKEMEIKECRAPFHFDFFYQTQKPYQIGEIEKSLGNCGQKGFYFFFDQEFVFDYMFCESSQPRENWQTPDLEEKKHQVSSNQESRVPSPRNCIIS
jgi:hypothetical protein